MTNAASSPASPVADSTVLGFYDGYWKKDDGGWSPVGVTLDPHERSLLERFVPKGGRVLDYGCGDGSHLGPYILSSNRTYVGADISLEAVNLCRRKGLEASQFDASNPLPWTEAAFDSVVSFEVLEHLFRPDAAVQEIHRVLRKGGTFVGSVPNAAHIGTRALLVLGRVNPGGSPETSLRKPWADPHIRFFTVRTLSAMLVEAGFANVRVHGAKFTARELPLLYRVRGSWRRIIEVASSPFGVLGTAWPALFSHRLYFSATKV